MADKKKVTKSSKSTLGRQLASQLAASRRITANLNAALGSRPEAKKL